MKKLFKRILVMLNLILTLACASAIYDLTTWPTKSNSESPNSIQTIPPLKVYIHKPNKPHEKTGFQSQTVPPAVNNIPEGNHSGFNQYESNRASSSDTPEANKYPLNVTGSRNSVPGFVIVDENGTVYTELNNLVFALGWNLLKDGSVFSDKQLQNKILKFELNNLPNSSITFKGRSIRLEHPVLSIDGSVVVPLSDLKDLWILDFSIDPVSKSLNLKRF